MSAQNFRLAFLRLGEKAARCMEFVVQQPFCHMIQQTDQKNIFNCENAYLLVWHSVASIQSRPCSLWDIGFGTWSLVLLCHHALSHNCFSKILKLAIHDFQNPWKQEKFLGLPIKCALAFGFYTCRSSVTCHMLASAATFKVQRSEKVFMAKPFCRMPCCEAAKSLQEARELGAVLNHLIGSLRLPYRKSHINRLTEHPKNPGRMQCLENP